MPRLIRKGKVFTKIIKTEKGWIYVAYDKSYWIRPKIFRKNKTTGCYTLDLVKKEKHE